MAACRAFAERPDLMFATAQPPCQCVAEVAKAHGARADYIYRDRHAEDDMAVMSVSSLCKFVRLPLQEPQVAACRRH